MLLCSELQAWSVAETYLEGFELRTLLYFLFLVVFDGSWFFVESSKFGISFKDLKQLQADWSKGVKGRPLEKTLVDDLLSS